MFLNETLREDHAKRVSSQADQEVHILLLGGHGFAKFGNKAVASPMVKVYAGFDLIENDILREP